MGETVEDLIDAVWLQTDCRRCQARHKAGRLDRGRPTVRVGPRPGMRQADDRWGRLVPQWYATSYGLVTERRWAAVQDFQTPVPEPTERYSTLEEAVASPSGQEIKRKLELNPSGTVVWEMGLEDPIRRGEHIRYCAVLGEPYLVRWSWFDAWVRLPAYVLLARVRTMLG